MGIQTKSTVSPEYVIFSFAASINHRFVSQENRDALTGAFACVAQVFNRSGAFARINGAWQGEPETSFILERSDFERARAESALFASLIESEESVLVLTGDFDARSRRRCYLAKGRDLDTPIAPVWYIASVPRAYALEHDAYSERGGVYYVAKSAADWRAYEERQEAPRPGKAGGLTVATSRPIFAA